MKDFKVKMLQYSAAKKRNENLIHGKVLKKCELLHQHRKVVYTYKLPRRKFQISVPDVVNPLWSRLMSSSCVWKRTTFVTKLPSSYVKDLDYGAVDEDVMARGSYLCFG